MKLFYTLILSLVFLCTLSCKQNSENNKETSFRDIQISRIVMINTFSATDSAIKAVAYFNDDIISISEDRGGGISGVSSINRLRGWSINLREGITEENRKKLINFLQSLEDPYKTIAVTDFGSDSDRFDYEYIVTDFPARIDVQAKANYTKREANE